MTSPKPDFNRNKVFYSWQSDSPDRTNRSFIQDSLTKAIKEINRKYLLQLELDSDTRGEPGAPDIANTILQKINYSLIFVADVFYVTLSGTKGIPNPNVMFELGYAIKSHGDRNIILIFNENSGHIKEMPFDLGLK